MDRPNASRRSTFDQTGPENAKEGYSKPGKERGPFSARQSTACPQSVQPKKDKRVHWAKDTKPGDCSSRNRQNEHRSWAGDNKTRDRPDAIGPKKLHKGAVAVPATPALSSVPRDFHRRQPTRMPTTQASTSLPKSSARQPQPAIKPRRTPDVRVSTTSSEHPHPGKPKPRDLAQPSYESVCSALRVGPASEE